MFNYLGFTLLSYLIAYNLKKFPAIWTIYTRKQSTIMLLALLLITFAIAWYLIHRNFSYWKRRGVPGPQPIPIVGNIGKNVIGKKNVGEIFTDIYRRYDNFPYVGVYRTFTPCLLVRDEELIKNIIVKDFKHFADNDNYVDKNVDPLFGRNPFVLKGEEWKKTRSQLTPCFTSGKMKAVFPLLDNVSKNLIRHIKEMKDKDDVDAKEICTKFTCDNVAVSAFGIEGKCLDEEKSEFRHLADEFMNPNSLQGIILSVSLIIPMVSRLLTLKLVPKWVEERLIDVVEATIEYREKNKVVRNDFLDSINNISKTTPSFTTIDVAAHAASFFVDGFETSSLTMAFLLFDLATNQDCQRKLRDEINSVWEKNDGKLSYEDLHEMAYLDACVNESLRLHPPLAHLSKTCTARYTLGGIKGSKEITLEPSTTVIIPVLGLHMDPKHFPEPEKFHPERFFNKEDINKYIYLPFGEGPRSCLGRRFGLFQVKIGIFYVIKSFEVSVGKSMKLPIKHLPFYLLLFPTGGFRLNLREI